MNSHRRLQPKMLLGKKAGSEVTVGKKPILRVSFQECPTGSSRWQLEGGTRSGFPLQIDFASRLLYS